jgi:hypothetical protein
LLDSIFNSALKVWLPVKAGFSRYRKDGKVESEFTAIRRRKGRVQMDFEKLLYTVIKLL